ncbi:NADH-quinone oxidoreductase subunit N [Nocardioides baekrokdamisoli]|uniref:NADH-quinone oxidoreductase subunit N n=1 Tax=Nocardioides baekrokdamisoli TaxID=1804624 RepID=A0A3G9J347_9ACTN|nr:NADH-quinone oxidoreductase subunit NuoN [Nocardioides baekrokdamisoli]BBH17864.1 NADH-quinone oxidoreductase subunit N [Nocardioides baekrokdamisoli]
MTIDAGHINYGVLWPTLTVFGAACVAVLGEAFLPRTARTRLQPLLALAALVTAFVGVAASHPSHTTELTLDGPGLVWQGLALLASILGVLLFTENRLDISPFVGQAAVLPGTREEAAATHRLIHTEAYALLLFAAGGMMLLPVANDVLLLFVAIEVLSLPLYVLTGLARKRRLLSQEASLKYFLLGAFASGFLVYGIALAYGASGSMQLADLGKAHGALAWTALALLAVGLLFKVGAVPFHTWTPDVYQGAPTPVAAWMSAATKVAAAGALTRLLWIGFGADPSAWRPVIAIIAALSMALGSAFAVAQTDVKRLLAYSAIAHTGFLLVGILGTTSGTMTASRAVMLYLVAYVPSSIGAFALVSLVRKSSGESTDLDSWAGIGRRHPWFGFAFAILLISMAGIPPTVGFLGKWGVFATALAAHQYAIVMIGLACSVVSVFFYARVLLTMFFALQPGRGLVHRPAWPTVAVIAVCVAATLAFGLIPAPMLSVLRHAGDLLV